MVGIHGLDLVLHLKGSCVGSLVPQCGCRQGVGGKMKDMQDEGGAEVNSQESGLSPNM